jgi:hypothetical protein
MAMLGGSCSKCCTKDGLKCYVPADDFGQCCKLSDGSCQNVRSCECLDGDAPANFYPGQECGDCYRYCRDFTTVRGCVVTNTPIPEEVDNAVEVPPGGPCECCPQVDPQRDPMYFFNDTCGCCEEYPAVTTQVPDTVNCRIDTPLFFSGDYTLTADWPECLRDFSDSRRKRWSYRPNGGGPTGEGDLGPCGFYNNFTGGCDSILDPPVFNLSEIFVLKRQLPGGFRTNVVQVLFTYYTPTGGGVNQCGCGPIATFSFNSGENTELDRALCGFGAATDTMTVFNYFGVGQNWDIGTITIGGSSNPLP